MNIYFVGSADNKQNALSVDMVKLLSQYGVVATGRGHEQQSSAAESVQLGDDREIFERNMSWLAEADVVVAEVSISDSRIGYEIAHAEIMEKQILCLYKVEAGNHLPVIFSGNANIDVQAYETPQDLAEILEEFLKIH